MTVAIDLDDQLANRAQEVAEGLGLSLDQLIRRYLEDLTSQSSAEEDIAEIRRLSGRGNSQGWKFDRDEIHKRHDEDAITEAMNAVCDALGSSQDPAFAAAAARILERTEW